MSPTSRPRTVLVTGAAKRLGRSIALALAAGGWQVAVHYRASAQDAMDTVAACADLAGASAHFDADFEDEAAVRGLVPRVITHFGQLDAVVNSASLFEHDDVQTFGFAALEKHLRSNTATPVLLAQPTYKWGYVSVEKIVAKVQLKEDVPVVNTMELVRVTKDNLGEWARQLKEWGFTDVPEQYLQMK